MYAIIPDVCQDIQLLESSIADLLQVNKYLSESKSVNCSLLESPPVQLLIGYNMFAKRYRIVRIEFSVHILLRDILHLWCYTGILEKY